MFALAQNKMVPSEFALIERDYTVLLFDEVPILFTGISKFNSRIIGTSIDEDYQIGVEWYFHLLVTDDEYDSYIRRRVSYFTLLSQAGAVYVVEIQRELDKVKVYLIAFSDIPKEYHPLESSYFPRT